MLTVFLPSFLSSFLSSIPSPLFSRSPTLSPLPSPLPSSPSRYSHPHPSPSFPSPIPLLILLVLSHPPPFSLCCSGCDHVPAVHHGFWSLLSLLLSEREPNNETVSANTLSMCLAMQHTTHAYARCIVYSLLWFPW